MSRSQIVLLPPDRPVTGVRKVHDIDIDGSTIRCGVVSVSDEPPMPAEDEVVVAVSHFSISYRDRAISLNTTAQLTQRQKVTWWPLGSEFAGTVVRVGDDVDPAFDGMDVMGRNDYIADAPMPQGVSTNTASRRYLVMKSHRVVEIPVGMDRDQAAAFTLGAQTGASLARRAAAGPGRRILVTGGNSHTSRFAAQFAALSGASVVVTSRGEDRWGKLNERMQWTTLNELAEQAASGSAPSFDAVIDPFIDTYAPTSMGCMKEYGTYVTCGFAGQALFGDAAPRLPDVFAPAMVRNARIEVNAIGVAEDLDHALSAFTTGTIEMPPVQVYDDASVTDFLDRSFGVAPATARPVYSY